MARRRDDVHRITSAGPALSDDQAARTRRYLMSMAIRTVCFLGAVLAQGWLRWTLVVAALVLPYVAVVVANAGREGGGGAPDTAVGDRTALGGGRPGPGPLPGGPGGPHPAR